MGRILFWLLWACHASLLCAAEYYVAARDRAASDSRPGTEALPFKTITKACEVAKAGDTVYIKQGVYREALMPRNSGREGKPIVFTAWKDDFVMVKGSVVVDGFEKEGDRLWVKRPWTKRFWWSDASKNISVGPHRASARMEQVFVNGVPLQWVPSRKELVPGSFYWLGQKEGGELVICPPQGVSDSRRALVEIPMLNNVVCAWQGDPRGLADLRMYRKTRPEHPWAKRPCPEIHYIHVRGLHFRHAAHTLNRIGVRLDGDHWLIEDCVVEYMNCIGIGPQGDHCVIRRCTANYNGQCGITGSRGEHILIEDCVTMFNNRKLFSISWGGAGNKLCATKDYTVRRLTSCFNAGAGIWFDIDCGPVLIEDCLTFGNRPVNAGLFYEISWDATIRRNISFANQGAGGSFYGAGVVLSGSRNNLVEDNVILGGTGGLSVGGGRRADGGRYWHSSDNLFQNNVVVEPHNFTISVRRSQDHDSTTLKAANRFVGNVFMVQHGTSQVHFGHDLLPDPQALDAATRNATDNVCVKTIADLDKRSDHGAQPPSAGAQLKRHSGGPLCSITTRVNDALKAVLNALVLAEPALDLKVKRVRLKEIWPLGGTAPIFGYWVDADGKPLLMLDVAKPGSFQLVNAGPRALLWDFPILGKPVRRELTAASGLLTAKVDGAFALIAGLSPATKAPGDIVRVSAVVAGLSVVDVLEGGPFKLVIEAKNPFEHAVSYTISGTSLEARQARLRPGEATTIEIPMVASPERTKFSYQVVSDAGQRYERSAQIRVSSPLKVPLVAQAGKGSHGENKSLRAGETFRIDRESQRVRDIHDEKTGAKWDGPKDLSGRFKVAWNSQGLFIRAEVTDGQITPNFKAPWEGDCIELFVDGRKKSFGRTTYTKGVYQVFLFPPEGAKWQKVKWRSGQTARGITASGRRTADGYLTEIKVDWALFDEIKPKPGALIGLDIGLDDADGKDYRKTQMFYKGKADNFKNAGNFGRVILAKGVQVDLGVRIQSGDVVARNGRNELAILRPSAGSKPLKIVALSVDGKHRNHFAGGVCIDASGNLYFADGFQNLRIQRVPAGQTTSQVVFEFPKEAVTPYYYVCSLLSVGEQRLLALKSDGVVADLVRGDEGLELVREAKVFRGTHGGNLALSPDGRLVAAVSNDQDAVRNLALIDLQTLKVVSGLGDSSRLFMRPNQVCFAPGPTPFLAVSLNRPLPSDRPDEVRRHIVRIDYDSDTHTLKGPASPKTVGGPGLSLVAHTDPGGNAWLSTFDAMGFDTSRDRFLLACRTRRGGCNVYAVSPDALSKGGLSLSDLAAVLDVPGGIVKAIAFAR